MKRRHANGICRLAALLLSVLVTVAAAGQARITTKKYRLSDFSDKVTKIVLSGNAMMDGALKQDIPDCWKASPFEFCTAAEFDRLKKSDKYYFLLTANGKSGKGEGPGLTFLTLVKGGPAADGSKKAAVEGLEDMMEVVSIPCGTGGAFGRELVFLPALLDIVQQFTLQAMANEISGYSGLGQFNANYRKDGRIKRICFSLGDFAPSVDAVRMGRLDEDILLVPEEEADEVFLKGTFNTLVSFVVAPENPVPGDLCYKMLIDAETHRLYYFKSHRISARKGRGFLPRDLKILSRRR